MKADEPGPGGAMLIASGPHGLHLYVIVTARCRDGAHLLLSITSIKPNRSHDATCVLDIGDHSFVQHPSYIDYSKPEQRPAKFISAMIDRGAYELREDVSSAVLAKICNGVTISDFSRPWMVRYFKANAPVL